MAKPFKRIEARKLRRKGESIKQIARSLGVSPGSVSIWCKDIRLSESQIIKLEKRYRDPFYGRRLEHVRKQQEKRIRKTERLKLRGIKDVGKLKKREFFLVGAALYWAEGFKKDSQAGLASSDPDMIKFYIRWLKECFGYQNKDLSLRLTINESHNYRKGKVLKFWANYTNTPINQFQKTYLQKVKWKKIYDNPENYYGVLRVKVRKSTDFLRKIHGFIEGLKKQV